MGLGLVRELYDVLISSEHVITVIFAVFCLLSGAAVFLSGIAVLSCFFSSFLLLIFKVKLKQSEAPTRGDGSRAISYLLSEHSAILVVTLQEAQVTLTALSCACN